MAARDDAGARKAQHEKEVRDLQTQISFLEEEISVLRRKLAESPDKYVYSKNAYMRRRQAWPRLRARTNASWRLSRKPESRSSR